MYDEYASQRSRRNEVKSKMEIGSKLKDARKKSGITQEQAAELLGVSRQTISNWENDKSIPDIISVIKMSDIFSVSLDHLLKEDKTMNQTYQEFLEESTNTVKAKKNLSKTIILSTYFIVWMLAVIFFWYVSWNHLGIDTTGAYIVLKGLVLPLLLMTGTIIIAKNDFWGRGKWWCVVGAAITFLTIPYKQFVYVEDGTATLTFQFPNVRYMLVGIIVSFCGIIVGSIWSKRIIKTS